MLSFKRYSPTFGTWEYKPAQKKRFDPLGKLLTDPVTAATNAYEAKVKQEEAAAEAEWKRRCDLADARFHQIFLQPVLDFLAFRLSEEGFNVHTDSGGNFIGAEFPNEGGNNKFSPEESN
jgi:hypothetical protein